MCTVCDCGPACLDCLELNVPGHEPEAVMLVATRDADATHKVLIWRCVGCGDAHACQVAGEAGGPKWGWNGSLTGPTLTPSVLKHAPGKRCHSFVRDGVVKFLSDCEHDLTGQSVRMLPENADPFGP